ncbi:hypothetical protein LSAT2_028338 [Lamellibrachia satsuma]|nr:hypothetical protein LSAT2_028338 [Lamellibrachia satsuma]
MNASDEVNNSTTNGVPIPSFATFLMCVMGMPGNVLVIAVYAWKMTTSTKVYMFALAVADLVVCICGIVLTTVTFDYITLEVTTYGVHMSVTFSVLLLAFVSIERLLAVRRPHTFSLNPLRAKRALVVIAVAAAASAMVLTVARVKQYTLLVQVFPAIVTLINVVVMVVCYSLMAITMLMNVRNAQRNVGASSSSPAPGTSTVPTVTYLVTSGKATVNVTTSKNRSLSRTTETTAKQASTYKSVSVLFIITVAFLACWLPLWLDGVGLHVPSEVERMFLINSVVNPFIYSAVSRMFRDDVRKCYGQMRSRLASCHC